MDTNMLEYASTLIMPFLDMVNFQKLLLQLKKKPNM
jgi:hypothetical protein